MALTRLDNLISSKTGKYLYVSPDDFNASDELNNRGNSPIRPFKSIQRAFIEISRYSYQPGPDNDRFDQFTVMVMPGKHYIDNRPGLVSTDGIDAFSFDQALGEWADSSNLDISDPNNKLYLFNNTEGGAIIPRGSSIIGYDLRRTSVHPLFVPDPADMLEKRSAIFNVTGGCYFWQFTIRDGDLEPASPLYDQADGVGKVYYQNGKWNELAVPNFSHHKLTVFEYADKEELTLYYQKIAKAFAQYQPTIDDANEFGDRIEETRIVGPLSDIRAIESIKCTDSSPAQTITVEVTTKVNHGYFKNQFIAIESNGLDDAINGTFAISSLDLVDKRKFTYKIPGTVSALGTITNLVSGTTYTNANGLDPNCVVKAEVDSVESASPYVFNCSIRSTWGICGIWANGLKATGFKSMVIAQYTGVSLQKDDRAFIRYDEFTNTFNQASLTDAFATVPYHTKGDAFWKDDWRNFHVRASEDAFIQCVSIFAVGYADHFLMESGGDMSITNSNSNFGNTSLHAIGHKGYSFNQDKGGYITDIVPPQQVEDTAGNTARQSYYTLDVYASNDAGNHTKIYHGDDSAYDPSKRPAATIGGYRIGAKTDDKLKVKLNPATAGGNNKFFATLEPSGFKKFTAAADILNPSGVTINNKTLDAADRIEANKEFIMHEAYDRVLAKYPALKVKESITITKCRRDVGYLLDATIQDLRLGGNVNTIQAAESYYVGNNLSYITGELTETLEGYNYAKDLAIAAMRNFTYLRTGVGTSGGSAIVNIGDTSGVVEGMTVADYDPAMFTDGKLNAGATRPGSPTIPNNTFVKKIIDSTSIELGDNTQTAQKKVFTDRHGNARELILANKTFIATEAYERMLLDYPGYTPSTGYTAATGKAKCIDDLEKAIAAIAENVGYGGNAETWDASDYYTTGAVTDLAAKKDETLTAFNYCKDMAVQVMRKENVFVYGAHGLTQSTSTANDPITDDPSPELVSNRNGDARNLIISNKNLIAAEAVERMVSTSSTQKFTPSGATYDPTTGDFVITSAAHGLTAATSITATGASYTPADGKLIITSNGHGFTNGQKILIKDGSLNFECAMDAGATIHSYPRPSDPFSGKWLTISNKTTNTFEVNVGASSQVTYTPTTGTTYSPSTGLMVLNIGNHSLRGSSLHTPTAAGYNPTTGVVTLTVSNHGFSKGDKVKLNDNSLTFTCAQDSHATNHTYPRSSDPISGEWQEITNVTKDTFDITVLTTTPSTNVTAHIFVGASNNALIRAGESIRLAANSLKFSCGFGGATGIAAEKTYPRSSDPFYNNPLPIESATVDTITVQVLTTIPSTNTDAHTFVSATAGAVETGGSYAHNFTSAVANGILAESDSIRIDYEALKFTCAMDGHATYHSYPKVSDPAAGKILPVTSKTTDTFTVNVGKSLDKKHDVTGATYNTSTGDLILTLNKHNLIKGNTIRISDNSLSFKCSKDGNVTTHTYPRNDTSQHTITAAAYNPTTGIVTATIAAHGFENGDMIILADNSLTFTCLEDSNATNKTYPRATDPVSGKYIPVSNVTTNTFEIQILDVTPSTNVTAHTFVSATANGVTRRKDKAYQNSLPITKVGSSFHTATDATYTPKDGILELTVAGHGMSAGDRVKISRDSLVFKCAMDNYGSEHKYPRATDPSDGNWLAISNVTTNTFKVNVGVADADQKFTPTAGTYDASSGDLVLTIGTHTLAKGESVTIDNESLSFTCTMDSNAEAQSYPRAGKDKASSRSLPITAVTGTTITINVGAAGTNKTFKPTASTYNADTGEMSLTIGQHGIAVGSDITLKDNSLTFTCSKDSNASQHTYPRPGTDPYAGKSLTVEKVGSSSHTATGATYDPTTGDMVVTVANHDFEKPTTHSPTLAVYNPTTGIVTLTITNHGLDNGDFVKIADGGLKFTCVMDGNSSIKAYPRSTDPASGANLEVSNVTANTFDVQILAFTPSTNTTTHTFSSADANCISNGGDYIQVADDSLTFTCTLDGNTVNKAYPRKGYDDASGKWFQITAVAGDTFTINVGAAGDNTSGVHTFVSAVASGIKKQDGTLTVNVGSAAAEVKTPTSASYNPTTGVMTLTAAGHGLANGGKVRIAKESLKFTCAEDGNSATKLYPRATDPVYDKAITISNVTTDTFDVQVLATTPSTNVTSHVFTGLNDKLTATGAAYNAKTGIMTLTVASHGLIAGERIKLADNSISMTCAMDGNYVTKTYPRTTDPQRDKWIPVSNITTNTFDVQVGKAPLKSHTPTAAAYNPTSGIMEMTIGTHGYVIGDNVKIKKESLIFTCDQDSNATEHAYPRATTTSHTPSTAAYNPTTGVMTLTVNGHGFENNDWVKLADGAVTFNCAEDSNATDHAYPRASDPISKKFVQISNVTTNTFDVQVLASAPSTNTTAHVFVSAVANSITKKTDPYYDSAYQVTGVSATTISVQVLATPPSSNTTAHTFVTALPNAITAGGDYAHTFVSATASGITRASVIVGDQYTHTFVEASLAAVEYSPNSAHTWVSGKADCVKHYPDQIHKFVRGIANGVQRQNGTVTVNVGASGPGDQYAHTFVSALSGAVTSGASGMGVLNISAASYAPTTGVMELTLGADHGLVVGTQVKIAQDSLTFRCAMDTNASTHTYPRSTDPVYNKYTPITAVSGTTISINVGKSPIVSFTPTGATYDPNTGLMELTIGSHSLAAGTSIKVDSNSLKFTCEMDGNYSTKSYPRATDPVNDTSIEITAVSATTITIDVGQAPIVSHNVDDGSYNPATGDMTLKIGNHSLTVGESIKIADGGVTFSCTYGSVPHTFVTGAANGITDDGSNNWTAASGTTYDPVTGALVLEVGAHALNAASTHTVTDATYNPATGSMVVTLAGHGFSNGDRIKFAENAISLTCTMDGNVSTKTYPRKSDPTFGKWLQISNVATDTFAVNVGTSPLLQHTPTGANYNPTTGIMELTIGAHSLTVGTAVKIADNSLIFTCAEDSNATQHTYPRATDPFSDKSFAITDVTATTISVQVLSTIPSTNTTDHTFVSATANCVTSGGNYSHTFVSAIANGLKKANNTITFAQDALTFTCDADSNATQHTYPRAGDPFRNETLGLDSVTATTMTVFVGFAASGSQSSKSYPRTSTAQHTAAAGTTYNPTTGVLSITTAAHNIKNGDYVQFATGALTFTCMEDNNNTQHTYPRVGDPVAGKWLEVSNITSTTFEVNVLDVLPSTNVTAHTFVSGSANGITQKIDRAYDQAIEITGVTADTIIVNVGSSSQTTDVHTFVSALAGAVKSGGGYVHTFKSADAGAVKTGGNYAHTFVSATAGALITGGFNSHKFISAKTNSVHKTFSVAGNRTYHSQDCIDDVRDLLEAIADNVAYGGNDKTWDAAYSYKTGNHVAGASKTVTAATYTPADGNLQLTIGTHTNKIGERVRIPQGALRFTCAKDSNATNHDYPRATDPIATFDPTITAVTGTTITVNVGPANDNTAGVHTFVSAAKQIQVGGEEKETNIAFNHAKAMASQVIKNQKVLSTGSHGLSQVFDTTITTDTTQNAAPAGANGDAYNLLISNADLISNEAYNRMILNHSDFLPPTGNKQDCIDDIKDFVVEVAHNVGFGGNDRVWDMAQLYVTGAHVAGEETQTLEAFQDATQLAIQAMRNEKILITGSHGKTQTFDTTITSAVETPLNNKAADAFILLTLNKNFIADVAMARMIANNGSYVAPTGYTQNDCKDDLKDIVDVLAHNVKFGGNDRIWDTANLYVGGAVAAGAVLETVEAVNHLRDIAIECVQNATVTVTSGQTSYTQVTYPATGSGTGVDGANPKCANETAAITSLSLILTNAISTHSTLASVTRTASTYKCTTIESTINTLSTIVQNAISTPASLSGSKASVSTATYAQASGLLELTVGAHSYKVGESVNIPNESLIFTCAKDSDGTQHAYPRSTDPMGKASSNITAVTATTITVNIGAAAAADQYAHTFVRSTDDITVGGIKRTDSVGRCQNVRSTLESLFKIVTDTITTPSSLNSVVRNISNGKCQNVASTISTLFGILTNAITTPSSLDLVDRTTSPTGLSTGNAVNASATTTNSYLYFTLTAGRYTSAYTPAADDTITQDTGYPQCNTVADAVRQYFANITTIIQTGLNTVSRVQPGATSDLSSRSTIFTLKDWTPGPTSGSNPHQLETGTAVRLVPRPRYNTTTNQYVTVDKRNVRLPNGFDTNTKYYVIAPGRTTQPENYSGTTTFNGSDQTKLMLASSRENAAAGIYIHSAEVEAINEDIEIDIYQFVLDDKYDLHQYKCVLATAPSGGIQTEVPHIFDIQNANVTAQKVFFRKNEGGSLPTVSTSQSSDATVADQSTAKLLDNKFFYVRYQNAKVFTIHKTHADAISNTNPIVFQSGSYDFSVFADKRESPMRYNPTHPNSGTTPTIYGKWYMQVKNESTPSTADYDAQSILSRFHDAAYSDASGNNKTNDSWFERLKDERDADERIFRLRYVIPKYLKSVRDPLNGFTIKMRKDETRKLLPQRLMLKPVSGSITQAKFYNTSDSGQATEIIGYTDTDFANTSLNLDVTKQYDPYKKDTSGSKQYAKNIRTANTYVDMTIESAKFITSGSDTFTEITVVNPRVENVALKNEIFTTVKVTAPQGGTFAVNATQNVTANAIEWTGNSTGSGYLHAAINVPSTTTWHLIIKGVSGDLKFSATDNVRFTQGAVFADLMDYPDYGKSLVLKDLIKENLPGYYYRQNGAKVYTITPGDIITDDANVQFYVESVEDTGELNDTFYIFNVKEIQKRIFDQQDGIFYLTALRGNHSPYPTGAGNQNNFRDFKFSQPVSKLYPLNYKNDPLWFKQVDANAVDPPATYSAADNYVHGLVTVNDFKGSSTKESVIDMLATEALKNNTYTDVAGPADNRLRAQTGNASAGSEDRLIPISGDAITVSQKKLYVELRRPSIARAGNHTFEYLGFGPGNYSTGFPARQEVLLTSIQDFYAQSKKQNGGLVFYTGLNSNGDLYIGNRKIDAITGEEEFLESATLVDSSDEDDAIGNLVTTFDTPVTFNEYITVNGGEDSDKTSTFNSPVTINVPPTVRDTTLGIPTVGVLSSLKVVSNVSNTKDDITLDTTNMQKNTATRGNILIAGNKVSAGIFEWNQRGSDGGGQGYKILTHSAGTGNLASNVTPDQGATYDAIQTVSYGAAGGPKSGDMLLKGAYVGSSGSLGWILSNDYKDATGNIQSLTFNGSTTITLTWKSGVTNANAVTGGVEAGFEIRIASYSDTKLNGTWIVNTGLTSNGNTLTFTINDIIATGTNQWSTQSASAKLEVAASSWKEWGVIGSQTIRTDTQTIGQYKLGVNTVARAAHADYATGFVNTATDPLANLDVVGTAWISGKTIENFAAHTTLAARTLTAQDHAFMVGGDSATPANAATLRVSTTNNGRVGINTTLAEMQSALTVKGTVEVTENAVFQKDVAINGGGAGSSNAADVTTTITDGTFNLAMDTGFVGLTSGARPDNGLKLGGSARNIEIGNVATASQNIKIGNTSTDSEITIGDSPDGSNANKSKVTLGGAYASTESDSFVSIGAKSFKMDGDAVLGARRAITDTVKLTSPSGKVEFFSNSGGPSIISFAEVASEITIAGQGGTTKVKNNFIVDGTSTFNSDMTLCGGYASYSFVGLRAQAGTQIESHTSGVLGNNLYNKNVDLITVLAAASTATDGTYNAVDTAGTGNWGGSNFQTEPASTGWGTLTGNQYYLPLKRKPVDAQGNLYYSEGDTLLIDTNESGTTHAEFVEIAVGGLKSVNTAPYWIVVERKTFFTAQTTKDNHPDTTAIFKCTVQYDSTWITANIDATGTEDNVYLATFGGNLTGQTQRRDSTDPAYVSATSPGDYVMLSRRDTSTPADGIFDDGEIFELKSAITQVAKSFKVKNGCSTSVEKTVFDIDSVTGDITATNNLTTFNGSLSLVGTCGGTTGQYPSLDETLDDHFKLSTPNGDTFKVNICNGDTLIGTTLGTVFAVGKYWGSTAIAHTTSSEIQTYRYDKWTLQTNGPITTVSAGYAAADTQIPIAGNNDAFSVGDLIMVNVGTASMEIMQLTTAPTESGGQWYLNTASNSSYPGGGRAAEGTTKPTTTASGAVVRKLRKYVNTTTPADAIPVTRTAVESPNTNVDKIRVRMLNSDLISDKLDTDHFFKISTGGVVSAVTITTAGTGYVVGDKIDTVTASGGGTGLVINVTSVSTGGAITGVSINSGGNGYTSSSVVIVKKGSATTNLATLTTTTVSALNVEWFWADSITGSAYTDGTKYSKSVPTAVVNGKTVRDKFFGGGKLTLHDDFELYSGNFRMYGSDGQTLLFNIGNDDNHPADPATIDPKTGTNGIFFNGQTKIRGDILVTEESCEANGVCSYDTKLKVESSTGAVEMGESLYIKGYVAPATSVSGDTNRVALHVDNLGPRIGAGTTADPHVGSKDFLIYNDSSIDAFGINRYWTRNGGRRYTYVAQSATGIGQTEASPLQPNNNYLLNNPSGTNMVLYLPDTAETGDMIRFIEVAGTSTYNTTIVIRAKKIGGLATAVQGDTTGSKIKVGSGQLTTAWDSGEIIIQTRNASFGLVFVGPSDAAGDPNASSIPNNLRGWWLNEL